MRGPHVSILVVDDEPILRFNLSRLLQQEGYAVDEADGPSQALERLQSTKYRLVLTDAVMPGGSGLDLIPAVKRLSPDTGCILVTGFGTIAMAVQAMKAGAFDFITKPYDSERVRVAIKNALEYQRLTVENESLRKEVRRQYRPDSLVGSSPTIMEVQRLIGRVADTDSTVLILGESGTGKELVARALHYQNRTRGGPFVPVNCGAIPENLLESELFGHEKGAFTGAVATHAGRFEVAHQGTLFLDEVGELSPPMQVKLLRVLQDKSFQRVGGTKTIAVDVRIIAATNRDLEGAVEERRFREDLYYRLNVIPICVPPLHARLEDIPLLAQHFLDQLNQEKGAAVKSVAPEAMAKLKQYRWPGNIRELENLMERIVVLKKSGRVEVEDLPARILAKIGAPDAPVVSSGEEIVFPPEGIDLSKILGEFERQLISKALDLSGGVKSRAAQLLGLNRTTLVEKMKKKGLRSPKSSSPMSDH
jgi:DNA-binding NtrC family response regulator